MISSRKDRTPCVDGACAHTRDDAVVVFKTFNYQKELPFQLPGCAIRFDDGYGCVDKIDKKSCICATF